MENGAILGLTAISVYGVILMVMNYLGDTFLKSAEEVRSSSVEEDKQIIIVAFMVLFGVLNLIFLRIFEYIVSTGVFSIYIIFIGHLNNFSNILLFPLSFLVVYFQFYQLYKLVQKLKLGTSLMITSFVVVFSAFTSILLLLSSSSLNVQLVGILGGYYLLLIFLISLYGAYLFFRRLRNIIP